MIKIEDRFYKDGADWNANCEEVGLIGYADPDINVMRENVFDSIRSYLETDDIEFLEQIITIAPLG